MSFHRGRFPDERISGTKDYGRRLASDAALLAANSRGCCHPGARRGSQAAEGNLPNVE
jgi:hypothetical protein